MSWMGIATGETGPAGANGNEMLAQLRAAQASGWCKLPDLIPIVGTFDAHATSTAVSGGVYRQLGVWILICEKAGTTAASAPAVTPTHGIFVDGTVYWRILGYLAPVAFANSLALLLDQKFAAGGNLYQVTSAGTTHASNPAPSTVAAGTHGTVDYVYIGPQKLPLITVDTSAPAGLSSQAAAWAGRTILSGTWTVNRLASVTFDGEAYNGSSNGGGGGMFGFCTDAPRWGLRGYATFAGSYLWVDGELAAWFYDGGGYTYRYVNMDASDLPLTLRNVRLDSRVTEQWETVYATGVDTFAPYRGATTIKAVLMGDSFAEFFALKTYGQILGQELGIDDFRVSGVGGAGIKHPGSYVNYIDRWQVDVLDHSPEIVIIQGSANDIAALGGGVTVDTIGVDLEGLISQSKAAGSQVIVLGSWNTGAALTGDYADYNSALETAAINQGVPFIDWSDFLNGTGRLDAPVGDGNADYYTSSDQTHPTSWGHAYRGRRLAPMVMDALEGLLG